MSIYDKDKLKIYGPESLKARNAAHRLAMLMNEKLGVVVRPSQLREMLQEDWTEISGLAHAIHDERRGGG